MEYAIGIVLTLLGYGWYQKSKRDSAEALNTNLDTKQKVQDLQANVDKGNASIEAEETKRKELQDQSNEKTSVSLTDLLSFFTKR